MSVCLSHSPSAAACGGFAAVGPTGRRYRLIAARRVCSRCGRLLIDTSWYPIARWALGYTASPMIWSHSSLAYYGAVPLQTKTQPLLLLLTDRRWHLPTRTARCDIASKLQEVCPLAHLPLPESSCRVRLRGGGRCRVHYASTLWWK